VDGAHIHTWTWTWTWAMDIHMDMDMGHGEAEMCRRCQTHKDEHAATERGALAAAQQPPRPHCVGKTS
jgi:hypothetical protein